MELVGRIAAFAAGTIATTAITTVVTQRATEYTSQIMIPGVAYIPTGLAAGFGAITAGMGVESLLPASRVSGGARVAATSAVAVGVGIIAGSVLGGRRVGLYGADG